MSQATPPQMPTLIMPATPAALRSANDSPVLQGLRRIAMPLIAFAPILIDAIIQGVNAGSIHLPDWLKAAWPILILAWQAYSKMRQTQEQQAASPALQAAGVPTGQVLPGMAVSAALNTTFTLRS